MCGYLKDPSLYVCLLEICKKTKTFFHSTALSEDFFFTLCLVKAPTIRGHTIPDSVPTPLEMPIRMLA